MTQQLRNRTPIRDVDTCFAPKWNKSDTTAETQPFLKICGVSDFIKDLDEMDSIDTFTLFFDDEVLEMVVFQTNLYAEQEYQRMENFSPLGQTCNQF